MARISRNKVKDEVLEKLFDLFFEIVGKKSNKAEFGKIVSDILSPTERIMIAKRIAIVYLLLKDIDYHNICFALKVSLATVAKFKLLMEKSDGVVPAFKTILAKDKISTFLDDFFNTLYHPGVYGINWKLAWQRKRESEQKKTFGI